MRSSALLETLSEQPRHPRTAFRLLNDSFRYLAMLHENRSRLNFRSSLPIAYTHGHQSAAVSGPMPPPQQLNQISYKSVTISRRLLVNGRILRPDRMPISGAPPGNGRVRPRQFCLSQSLALRHRPNPGGWGGLRQITKKGEHRREVCSTWGKMDQSGGETRCPHHVPNRMLGNHSSRRG